MGGAADFKVGVHNRIRERSEQKKLYPHFSKCGGMGGSLWVGGMGSGPPAPLNPALILIIHQTALGTSLTL